MKIKNLKIENLMGIKVKIPKKYEDTYQNIKGDMYIYSYWNAGVWFKKDMKEGRIYPISMNPKELSNFTIVEEAN